ncbi:hypothetical protein [Streptomyces pseudovenezuelae]|uniref:Uncharacterized protein n=1 Tax=Streptomyces pseudovenezuelae TaxID=67350 RepID=A0ABT6LLH4_9ACTN|nr:hypothetical protein [Streptomyces pseudovenezuelae]MDH6217160.1 hypothetical protein [Streptomyces pseudovenezuelae]
MSSGHRTMTLFVTVLLGMILVVLGLGCGWPTWAWPAMAVLLLVVGVVTHRILAPAPEAFPRALLPEPDLPLPEPMRQEQRVAHVALPSSVTDYDFSFCATVRWLVLDTPGDAPYVNPAGLAVDAVLQRARVVTAQQPPHRSAFTQHQLDGALATMRADSTGRVMAMAQDVSLSLPELDRERLAKLSNVRKDEDVWEHERNYERSKRAYLGEDVLKDTGSAVVWWLSRNDEEVEGAVDRIGLLARLSAAANNDEVAPPFEHLIPVSSASHPDGRAEGHERYDWERPFDPGYPPSQNGTEPNPDVDSFLVWFGFSADDPDVEMFAERLINLARVHGKTAAADEIKRRFVRDTADEGEDGEGPGPSQPDEPDR